MIAGVNGVVDAIDEDPFQQHSRCLRLSNDQNHNQNCGSCSSNKERCATARPEDGG